MYSPRFSCTSAPQCGRDGKAGENYAHTWTRGNPNVKGGYSVEEITFRAYTFNLIDGEGHDTTVWFRTIQSLYALASVLLIGIDTTGSFNDMGVSDVTFNPNGTVTVAGGVLASSDELVGKTVFSYTVTGSPRDVQARVHTLTSASAAVVFPRPFPGIPNVQATINSPVSATVSASAVTSSGFTLTVNPAPISSVDVAWLATFI